MFEELCDENDLEWTEHRLRVHVLTLKKSGDVESLFRLYGALGRVLARRGDDLKAQDALNDAEFLVVENKWRGTQNEIWGHYDRALVFRELGRSNIALRNLNRAEELLQEERDSGLREMISAAKETLVDES
jgi:hypothetical protein